MAVELERETREYIWFETAVTRGTLDGVTAEVALFSDPNSRPAATDWIAATLVGPTDPMGEAGKHYIRLLAGPSGAEWNHASVIGDYQAWTRLTSTPEQVVRRPGVVTIR